MKNPFWEHGNNSNNYHNDTSNNETVTLENVLGRHCYLGTGFVRLRVQQGLGFGAQG